MDPSELLAENRRHWDELVGHHVTSRFYDVDGFRRGRTTLLPLELKEVGPVRGKSLLHLQCHFGLDTLSWGREGAIVTGVDFSGEAIAAARKLAAELRLPAQFIQSDVLDTPDHLDAPFEIVFTSWGVLPWVPDLRRWAEVVSLCTKPGGRFYIAEIHPTALLFERPQGAERPVLIYDYFPGPKPLAVESERSYTGEGPPLVHRRTHQWIYALGDVVTALVDAGLRIEFVHEHPFSCYEQMPGMTRDAQHLWHPPREWPRLPFSFSLSALKPA